MHRWPQLRVATQKAKLLNLLFLTFSPYFIKYELFLMFLGIYWAADRNSGLLQEKSQTAIFIIIAFSPYFIKYELFLMFLGINCTADFNSGLPCEKSQTAKFAIFYFFNIFHKIFIVWYVVMNRLHRWSQIRVAIRKKPNREFFISDFFISIIKATYVSWII